MCLTQSSKLGGFADRCQGGERIQSLVGCLFALLESGFILKGNSYELRKVQGTEGIHSLGWISRKLEGWKDSSVGKVWTGLHSV